MGMFREIGTHPYQHVNAGEIVQRILKSREAYEERQRVKRQKVIQEDECRQMQQSEQQITQSKHTIEKKK